MPIKPIARALKEARVAFLQIVLFNSIIDSLVMFLIMVFICLLMALPVWWAVIPGIVYAIVHTRGNLAEIDFKSIEKKYPQLEEQLITVADNLRASNEIIEELNAEVLQKMKEIRTSSFLNFGKLTRELSVMAIISFVIIGMSAFNVQFLDLQQTIVDLKDFRPLKQYDINEELLEFEESQNLSEILGEKKIQELGEQQLNLQLNPVMSDIDIGKIHDPQERQFKEVPPSEIRAITDTSFEEDIPKQYQRIVKTYFKEITKS